MQATHMYWTVASSNKQSLLVNICTAAVVTPGAGSYCAQYSMHAISLLLAYHAGNATASTTAQTQKSSTLDALTNTQQQHQVT